MVLHSIRARTKSVEKKRFVHQHKPLPIGKLRANPRSKLTDSKPSHQSPTLASHTLTPQTLPLDLVFPPPPSPQPEAVLTPCIIPIDLNEAGCKDKPGSKRIQGFLWITFESVSFVAWMGGGGHPMRGRIMIPRNLFGCYPGCTRSTA